ncbi:transglutaminase family protein [Aliiglaciecola sp. CAU 1673]|uniref:transglutaminase family protein n=1 Tax=Aliiglaciecola sp. CAU 1673 TaxID=3032595 RepID=UPI0023D99DDF|nr:transglutaminase family protein [Aliiglaciecola sp. CAU 1673]MDF2176825.1 transglutaminase family protein [Aliiglaciecola sp. CAU 1673]
MRYRIKHTTTYQYQEKVSLSQNQARLIPQQDEYQRCISCQISVEPPPDYLTDYRDYFGNQVSVFEVPTLHDKMVVTAISEVEVLSRPQQGLFDQQLPWEAVRDRLRAPFDPSSLLAAEYCLPTQFTKANEDIRQYALQSFTPGRPMLGACEDLMARIFNEFQFDAGFSTINTPVSEVFAHKRGVCQDFSHFALACIRSLGLAARYVSGYIETLPPPGQPKLEGADATHAWFSVYMPGLGWQDFDPTNNLVPGSQHVTLASGRDFADITPLKGVMFGGGSHTLAVAVDMNRLD